MKRKRKRGRPPHVPTDKDRKQVEAMTSYGITEIDIARVMGIHVETLGKYYREELDTGHIKANSMVAQSLYQKALGDGSGAVAACIFWLKVRCKWVEPRAPEDERRGDKLQVNFHIDYLGTGINGHSTASPPISAKVLPLLGDDAESSGH